MPWKSEVRVIGFDDGPFTVEDDHVHIVGIVTRASSGYVEAVLHGEVARDGDDATQCLADLITHSRIYPNLVAVLVQNITVAGFNTIDLDALHAAIRRPVIAVLRGTQDWQSVRQALVEGGIANGVGKWQRIASNEARQVVQKQQGITYIPVGTSPQEAQALLEMCTLRGSLPEPIRLAHLMAAGWVLGESRGQ